MKQQTRKKKRATYSINHVELIRHAVDMTNLVSLYTNISAKGLASCCFHQEKSPSLKVDEKKKLFHCFGCGAGGDVFTFVMMVEKITFTEAVSKLASACGIKLPSDAPNENAGKRLEILRRRMAALESISRKNNAIEEDERTSLRVVYSQLPISRSDWDARAYTREFWIQGRFDELDQERRHRDQIVNEVKGAIRYAEYQQTNERSGNEASQLS